MPGEPYFAGSAVPVACVANAGQRPGGAANVARNLARLGAQARLAGLAGQDEAARPCGRSWQPRALRKASYFQSRDAPRARPELLLKVSSYCALTRSSVIRFCRRKARLCGKRRWTAAGLRRGGSIRLRQGRSADAAGGREPLCGADRGGQASTDSRARGPQGRRLAALCRNPMRYAQQQRIRGCLRA